jgi:hypothetical protein
MAGQPPIHARLEVIVCMAGRGFDVRGEDVNKLVLGTCAKVLTLQNMQQLVEAAQMREPGLR